MREIIPDASPCYLFATSLPPLWVLIATSDSEDPKRTQRGPKEEAKRRQRGESEENVSSVTGFREDRHIFERTGADILLLYHLHSNHGNKMTVLVSLLQLQAIIF
jgi:hypothetical protein